MRSTVQSYPDPAKRWRVSTDGGESPAWAHGAELFYVNGDRMMMVTMGDRPSVPRVLFEAPLPDQFAGSPDGQRFLMIQTRQPDAHQRRARLDRRTETSGARGTTLTVSRAKSFHAGRT